MENCMSSDLSAYRRHSTIPFHHSIPPFQSSDCRLPEFNVVVTTVRVQILWFWQPHYSQCGHLKFNVATCTTVQIHPLKCGHLTCGHLTNLAGWARLESAVSGAISEGTQ